MFHKIQGGFGLISVIFIIVILATISAYVVSISNMSQATSSMSVQGVRAYFAAKSGLEWGINQVVADPTSCPVATTINLHQAGLAGYRVQVSCSLSSVTESLISYNIFTLESFAEKGTFGSVDYVSRQMRVAVTLGF